MSIPTPKRFNVEAWFLRSLASGNADREQVTPPVVVEARDEAQARELYAARFQLPRDYYRAPRAAVQGDWRPDGSGIPGAGARGRILPICLFRVEEVRR